MNATLLGHAQCGLEICLHGECCDFVLLFFDGGFVGQAMDCSIDLFLRSSGVVKNVTRLMLTYFSLILLLISASVSIFCLPASMNTVVFERGLA